MSGRNIVLDPNVYVMEVHSPGWTDRSVNDDIKSYGAFCLSADENAPGVVYAVSPIDTVLTGELVDVVQGHLISGEGVFLRKTDKFPDVGIVRVLGGVPRNIPEGPALFAPA